MKDGTSSSPLYTDVATSVGYQSIPLVSAPPTPSPWTTASASSFPPAPARTAKISKMSHLPTVSQISPLEEVTGPWAGITHYFIDSSASLFL